MVPGVQIPRNIPRVTQHIRMNPDIFFCPIRGCTHSKQGTSRPFHSRTVLLRHLNSTTHASTHSLVNHSDCATAGIYNCCSHSCPASPKTFFSSLRALNDHCHQAHPPPQPLSPPDITHPPPTDPPSPLSLSTRLLHQFSPSNTINHWKHGLEFIDSVYHHEPPDFRTTWRHLIRSRNLSAFSNLQASIIRAIVEANTTCDSIDCSAPFWWLLFHLDMLIFAPSTKEQRNHISISHTIRDRINATYCGDIAFLFHSAMQVRRLKQNSRPTYTGQNRSAQQAADNDEYRTAVSRACTSQSIATIGPANITHVKKLYTPTVPTLGYPHPSSFQKHQTYSLPGNICDTIRHAARNKGAGVNADSIDLFSSLLKCSIPTITEDLQFIFDLIYKNKLPENIKRYFTDVYLFCLHKDPHDPTKLRPLGIPTAIRRLIGSHVARTLRQKFANHLLPYNYAVGVPDGSDFVVKAMQLSIEKYIDNPQQSNRLPTRAAIFFDLTNQFNSVAREEFKNVIAISFPELLPLVTLFYDQPNTVHYKWNDGSWRRLLMEEGTSQGCPLSPLFASFVVARLLEPIDGLLRERAATRLANEDTGDDGQGGISHLLSFVDDISSCVYLPDLSFLCEQVRTRGASIGCFVNSHKTRILTSCNGTSILPALTTHDPQLALSISNSIASFSTTPHPTDKAAPDIPVELTTGFRLLGQPVGSATFATEFFGRRIDDVKKNITSLLDNITDQQTRLRLFSQCIIQKLPHLLSADVLYHLPTDNPNPPWEEWNGPLTSNIESTIKAFFTSLLTTADITPDIPEYAILISQLGLRAGGLGILCPRTRAAPDFVITMASARRNALHGFRIHKDLPNFPVHQTIGALFDISTNTNSKIL